MKHNILIKKKDCKGFITHKKNVYKKSFAGIVEGVRSSLLLGVQTVQGLSPLFPLPLPRL